MEPTDELAQIKALAKQVRTLEKKLARSEADRQELEAARELREIVLKSVIRELEESQTILKDQRDDLETALKDLKALQVKLVESEKMSALGVLVAGVAHEINNPVSFIYGNLACAKAYLQDLLRLIQLYQQHFPDAPDALQEELKKVDLEFLKYDADRLFRSMTHGAERIGEIVKSLRTFSRLDESEFKVVDIHEGLESTLVILNSRLRSTSDYPEGIQLVRNYGRLPLLGCYPGSLNQVFLNILMNAIDALEAGVCQPRGTPTINLCTEANPNEVMIRIVDNALGMDETIQAKLFDPFFTTKEIGKGTGLGLAIAHQIITEKHQGRITVNSALGQGTTFTIVIPLSPAI
jgi:two-component system, NtrC family, sensor kinase